MASNQGNYDNAANVPLWSATSVQLAPTTTNTSALYQDVTANDFFVGATVGVFAVDDNEKIVEGGSGSHAGWVLRTVGSGGRAGRVQEETLSVVASFRSDSSGDDAVYQDSYIAITSQPSAGSVYSNTSNSNTVTFSVSVAAKPANSTVTYQWQYNNASGSLGWANVPNGVGSPATIANTTIAGNTTSTLSVSPYNRYPANTYVFRVVTTATDPGNLSGATVSSNTSSNAAITIFAGV